MMVTITDGARDRIIEVMEKTGQPVRGLRIGAKAVSPLKAEYNMALMKEGDESPGNDVVLQFDGFELHVDPDSLSYVDGASIDYIENLMGGGFRIEGPPKLIDKLAGPVAEKIKRLLDDQINPGISMHGGYVNLIDVKDNVAYVELGGGCQGCGMADVTLKQGIEVIIKENVPEITEVLDTTDHASGRNPYYQPAK